MQIAVIGTGYVGLVTGAGFAELGHRVACVDVDAARIERLSRGELPIHEPCLDDLVARNAALGRLTFTTSIDSAVAGAHVVFIAVGTPSLPSGAADLSYVLGAARDIGRALRGFAVVVTKSTVPVGTADKVRAAVAEHAPHAFAIASNPEFLKEGDAVNDFLKPARIVIGTDDPRALALLRELYRGILRSSDRIIAMDIRSAELTKYASNAMLATRISFMNELSRLAEQVGGDIESIRLGMGSDPRIGSKFLYAGCGFGGSCFGKDLRALIHTGREHDVQLSIIDAAERVNERQQRALGRRIISHFGGRLEGRKVAVWGLAFKPETDDIRESPALVLIDQVREARAAVSAYDPVAMPNVRAVLGDALELAPDAYAAAHGADALALITEWHELRQPDFTKLAAIMRTPVLFDGRNVWPPDEARRAGCVYAGIGRR
ncbi:MAG: UDP-glucose/GDP-mannose dehydrogenase family protein [Kofleriaceae bacterium]